jgi:hypothetical protein
MLEISRYADIADEQGQYRDADILRRIVEQERARESKKKNK